KCAAQIDDCVSLSIVRSNDIDTIGIGLPHILSFNEAATPAIHTLSLHDALPIYFDTNTRTLLKTYTVALGRPNPSRSSGYLTPLDRKSTRLNSSHLVISYAVFCLKKKIQPLKDPRPPPFTLL